MTGEDVTCRLCDGSGTVQGPDEVGPNAHPMDHDCPRCKGTGAHPHRIADHHPEKHPYDPSRYLP